MRQEIVMNRGWRFHLGDIADPIPGWKGPTYSQSKTQRKQAGPAAYNYPDQPDQFVSNIGLLSTEKWQWVQIPHDYMVNQPVDERENNALGYVHYENAWYRNHFSMPEGSEGKRVTLRFDGVAGESTIYLNGCLLGHNFSAYNTFELDISDYVYFDQPNVLAVYINRQQFEGWWYQGGGIYRNVHLTITDPVAIDLWGVYAPYHKISENRWQIDFQTTVVNSFYESCSVKATSYVLDKDGNCIAAATGEAVAVDREKTVLRYSVVAENPLLWDCNNPNLYTIKTVLERNGDPCDESTTRIGFRTVELSPEGLLLNGKKTLIKGVCAHQDYGITGLAVPDNVAYYKVKLLKEMGANGYRTSHYQQTEAYMDALDEMGFLVMDEARWFESTKESYEQIDSLVKRDRNRPSVIFWSTGNEEPLHIHDVGRRIHKAIAAHIRKLDDTRFIMAAQDKAPDQSTIYDDCDVIGINYCLPLYDTVHSQYPDKLIVASECVAAGTTRDWNFATNTYGRIQDKDYTYNPYFQNHEATWKHLMERPYVIGAYQWNAFEYRGEGYWPLLCSRSGSFDLFLQKKGAFYQNKSHWTEEPMVHIVPHWNFAGLEGQDITVTVYTNCDKLSLFVNGKSLGEKEIEKYGHGEWEVPYEPGELKVIGYREGKVVCEHSRVTTGKPVKLHLTLDNEFTANGQDLALITCQCLDAEGRPVPDAAEFVEFSVNAPAEIMGTGSDNCDHTPVKLTQRKMYMGKISIAVRPAKGQEKLELLAHSDCIADCLLRIKTEQ